MPEPVRPSVSSLLGDLLADGSGLRRFVSGLTQVGAGSVAGTASCSIRLAVPGGWDMSAHSDHRAEVCAHAEWQLGEGPGDLAMVLGAPPPAGPGGTPERADVERAVGVLVGLHGGSTKDARAELRERAATAGGSLRAVALAVVDDAAAGPPPEDATPRW